MNSLLTNMSAMTALQNLASTQSSLGQVQSEISSGLKVGQASDNAAYWSIATTMKSDTGALGAVSDALNLGSSTVNTANSAVTTVLTILNKLKDDLVTAQNPSNTTTQAQIQTDIASQQAALKSIVSSASFNGVNLLDGSQGTSVSFVGGFTRDSAGNTTVSTIGLTTNTIDLISSTTSATGILQGSTLGNTTNLTSFDITSLTGGRTLASVASDIDAAITAVTKVGTTIAKAQNTISTQATFVSALTDAITSGVGSLEDADMNVASTRLQALQTQQQLGIQSLSIANQNSQLILKLFNG